MRTNARCLGVVGLSILCVLIGCSGDDSPNTSGSPPKSNGQVTPPVTGSGGSGNTSPGTTTGAAPATTPPTMTPPATTNNAGAMAPPTTMPPSMMPPATAGSAAPPMATAGSGAPPTGTPPKPAAGPEDGDPSMPVVSIPDVACGGPKGGFGLGSPNFKIDDRD